MSKKVEFHIRKLKDMSEEAEDSRDKARIEKAWGRKRFKRELEFTHARNGDHFLVPFECDTCIFRKLRKLDPNPRSESDVLLMASIRRANLDTFWSRSSDTINANRLRLLQGLRLSQMVKLNGPYLHLQPFPEYDHCGYEVAIQLLLASRRPGRNSATHLQFDSIRHLLAAYGNQVRASPKASGVTLSLTDQKGRYQRFSTDATGSLWFKRFVQGCRYRMGQEWNPNKAFSVPILLLLLDGIERRIDTSEVEEELAE